MKVEWSRQMTSVRCSRAARTAAAAGGGGAGLRAQAAAALPAAVLGVNPGEAARRARRRGGWCPGGGRGGGGVRVRGQGAADDTGAVEGAMGAPSGRGPEAEPMYRMRGWRTLIRHHAVRTPLFLRGCGHVKTTRRVRCVVDAFRARFAFSLRRRLCRLLCVSCAWKARNQLCVRARIACTRGERDRGRPRAVLYLVVLEKLEARTHTITAGFRVQQ